MKALVRIIPYASLLWLAVLVVLVRLAVRGYKRATASIRLPMEMDPSAHVNVICWPDQKARSGTPPTGPRQPAAHADAGQARAAAARQAW